MSDAPAPAAAPESYSYLGPRGTFTEAALAQVPDARGKIWRSVNNVGEASALRDAGVAWRIREGCAC